MWFLLRLSLPDAFYYTRKYNHCCTNLKKNKQNQWIFAIKTSKKNTYWIASPLLNRHQNGYLAKCSSVLEYPYSRHNFLVIDKISKVWSLAWHIYYLSIH